MTEAKVHSNKEIVPKYDSNPFTLAFNSFGRFFKTNVGWAIALLVIGFFTFLGQLTSNMINLASTDTVSNNTANTVSTNSVSLSASSSPNVGLIVVIVLIVLLLVALVVVISTAVSVFINGMFSYVAIESENGKSVSFSEAWEATAKRFWRLFKAQLLAGLKIFAWSLLFIIPGIVASFRYALLPFVIMGDLAEDNNARTSHSLTKTLVKGRLIEVFGIATVAGIVPFVGQILGLTGKAALYTQLSAYHKAGVEKPKVHWLNYLGFILFGFILLLLILVGAIILAVYSRS